MTETHRHSRRRQRGFVAASGLLQERIRAAGEARGFAVARLLTHWAEVVGSETSEIARPVKISYGREGFGATLTLLTTGANAPVLQMQLPRIQDKVNACYGYNAISRVLVTQTAPTGFAEGQVAFAPAPKQERPAPSAKAEAEAATLSRDIDNETLRSALEALGQKVLSRAEQKKG